MWPRLSPNALNAALPLIRAAAAPDVEDNEVVQRKIKRLGGNVVRASPIEPNRCRNSPTAIAAVKGRSSRPADQQIKTSNGDGKGAIDGSSIWWANGFTGQGTSADGNGSPDAVVFDTGLTTAHDAFKTRAPEDLPTVIGTGRIVSFRRRPEPTFLGSKHGNTIARKYRWHGPFCRRKPLGRGDGLRTRQALRQLQAANPYLWDLGISTDSDIGLAGTGDLPEVINYSAGLYQDEVDLDPELELFDALESRFGILNTVSAGNCGD